MSRDDIMILVTERLMECEESGRVPGRIVLGNQEALDVEDYLERYGPGRPDIVNLTGPATLYGVPLKRVDLPSFLGVVAEGFEDVEA